MFGEDRITLEEYVSTLKYLGENDVRVDAIEIGKGKRDLTGTGIKPLKATHSEHTRTDLTVGKDFSSLSPVEILEVLTGDSRLSKAQSIDLFFEVVWHCLLAIGWQSVQPRDSFSNLSVVYLPPGIEEFSQGLIRGDEYFDSISDILKKIESDPELLELEEEAVQFKKEPTKDIYDMFTQRTRRDSMKAAKKFLQEGDKVKIIVSLKGRDQGFGAPLSTKYEDTEDIAAEMM